MYCTGISLIFSEPREALDQSMLSGQSMLRPLPVPLGSVTIAAESGRFSKVPDGSPRLRSRCPRSCRRCLGQSERDSIGCLAAQPTTLRRPVFKLGSSLTTRYIARLTGEWPAHDLLIPRASPVRPR